MLLKRVYDDGLAQAGYFIGCQRTGEAIVVDPRRDAEVYLAEARARNMIITAVTETHIHADYLSGSRELAAATGAALYLSGEGGDSWQYGFPHESLQQGERLKSAACVIDPERDDREIVVLAGDKVQAAALRDRLAFVGIDNVVGYLTDPGDLERTAVATVAATDLKALPDPYIRDLRTEAEFRADHIPGAHRLHAGRVLWHLDGLPRDRPVVTHCQSGARSAVVSSALRAAGFDNIVELEGSYLGWQRAQTGAGVV